MRNWAMRKICSCCFGSRIRGTHGARQIRFYRRDKFVNRQPVSRNKNQNGIAANAGEFYEDKIFVASILAAGSPFSG